MYKWALTQETLSSNTCEQQRHRPDCASAQSDRWFESHSVGNPEDRFSRVAAQMYMYHILKAMYILIKRLLKSQ